MKKTLAIVVMGLALPVSAFAASELDSVQALASLVVHEKTGDLKADPAAVETYATTAFSDPAQALDRMRTYTAIYSSDEKDMDGLEKTIRCASIRQFAEQNKLLAK